MVRLKYKILALIVIACSCLALMRPVAVKALPCPDGFDGGSIQQIEAGSCANHQTGTAEADDTEMTGGSGSGNFEADCNGPSLNKDNCGIVAYIVLFTRILSGLVGVIVVIMIAVGGVQYMASRDDPQAVTAAKNRIRNAILALVFYLFGFAFLQWLVPGGIF